MTENQKRERIIELCLQMNSSGLNQGTSGNISARHKASMLITPSGIAYERLLPDDIARVSLEHADLRWEGPFKPSSEWHFHKAILREKPEIDAVVHTHSTFATVLSISRSSIPACHYMIAAFGGNSVRCADYQTFGSPELSEAVLQAMQGRSACLLANHGMIAAGKDLNNAMWAAVELETLAKQFYYARLAGTMTLLSDDEMSEVMDKFRDYGQKER